MKNFVSLHKADFTTIILHNGQFMSYKNDLAIDQLIKRIYKSYIEIKMGEFREIDRDMLLDDVSHLYSSIKELYPIRAVEEKVEFEFSVIRSSENETVQNITPIVEELPALDIKEELLYVEESSNLVENNLSFDSDVQDVTSPIIESNTTVDLDLFDEDDDMFDEDIFEIEVPKVVDIKSDNTNSPIVQQFMEVKPKSSLVEEYKKVPIIESENTESSVKILDGENIKPTLEVESNPMVISHNEPEKRSADKIMNFLKHEEVNTKQDIYSLLDINTRIGLVELFFKGNSLELTECLVKVNKCDKKEDGIAVVDKYASMFGVKDTDDIYAQFINLVERKFR